MNGNIFISYRREDSAGMAGRIADQLKRRFPQRRIFMDVSDIDPGVDFTRAIDTAVDASDLLVVIIGARWLQVEDADGRRRIDNPEDFVHQEIAKALARDMRVVPVLVDEAGLPTVTELPPSLHPLTYRQAIRFDHGEFDSDFEQLASALKTGAVRRADSALRDALNEAMDANPQFLEDFERSVMPETSM